MNLLSNAAKFSNSSAQVDVYIECKKNQVRINVRDYGAGVPDAFKDRIFEKFTQIDASNTKQKGGTGLGLNISKSLLEKMGGNIGFDSIPGVQTTFYIELPISS